MFTMLFMSQGWAWGACLAGLSALAVGLGLVLFVIWAARLKQNTLKQWVIWLLVVGVLGWLLTGMIGWYGWGPGL